MAEQEITSFVAVGDSFTEGLNDFGPGGQPIGWADRVAAAMAVQVPGFGYANLAIRGNLVRDVLAGQVGPAIALGPDLVSIAAGGNDILRRADVDELAAEFDSGVARLRSAGCRVLIFTGFDPLAFPVIRLLRGRIAAYNMHLRAIADERGCDLVDLWSMRVLRDPQAWSQDRLHLTTEGHIRIALRTCEVLGVPVDTDWRVPLTADGMRSGWLAARRQDARWARQYALPWMNRRLRRTSTGDGRPPKRPALLPVEITAEVS